MFDKSTKLPAINEKWNENKHFAMGNLPECANVTQHQVSELLVEITVWIEVNWKKIRRRAQCDHSKHAARRKVHTINMYALPYANNINTSSWMSFSGVAEIFFSSSIKHIFLRFWGTGEQQAIRSNCWADEFSDFLCLITMTWTMICNLRPAQWIVNNYASIFIFVRHYSVW